MSLLTSALNRHAAASRPGVGARPAPARLAAQAATAWAKLAGRERRAVVLALTVVGLAALWWLTIEPAWRTLQQVPAARAALTAELQIMGAQAEEAARLRSLPKLDAARQGEALEAATRKLGGSNAAGGRVTLQAGSAVVTLSGVKPEALAQWLDEVRSTARGRITELKLTRDPSSSSPTWSGSAVVSLQR